ncbi:MAG: glycosidase [Candidatus Latescibacterota bacterium]|nr:MAG: glycosidase [Candidatus Latescibacterota bacterium]
MVKLKRWSGNPILAPSPDRQWEKEAVYNPGAILHQGKVYLLYRAVGDYEMYSSRFGLAVSRDGFHFERVSDEPVFEPGVDYDKGGCEDPRIVKMGEEFFITYAALPRPPCEYGDFVETIRKLREDPLLPRIHVFSHTGLLRSSDLRNFERIAMITPPDVDDRDGVLFPEKVGGRYVLLHRPTEWTGPEYGAERPSIWLAYSTDMRHWTDHKLLFKPEQPWEAMKIGAGPPPIKTPEGWLLIYHGVDENFVYRAGMVLLDLDRPDRVIARSPYPILEPEEPYEKVGDIPNVVFPTGTVVIDGELFVYYGAADKVCCVATAPLNELLEFLLKFKK